MADGGQDFNLGHVVGSAGEKGDDGSTVWNTSTAPTYANSKYTFTISNLSGKTGFQIAVNDIIFYSTYYYIVSAVNTTTVDCSTRVSIKGSDATVTIATSFGSTPSDSKVPSEKLTKNTLDTKVDKVTGKGLSTNDFTNSYKNTIDGLSTVATTGDYDDLTDKPSIPSSSSDLSDGSNIVKKSSTSGLLKNDGTVDTTSYGTFSGSYNDLSNKPTIPSASTTTPSADTTSGSYGSGTNYARSNHTHPKSSLYAEATHSHTKSQISDFPSIPSKTSDLTNDGADGTNVFVANNDSRLSDARTPTSHTHGQITNAGAITSTAVTVASGDNIVITDASDSSKVKRVTNLLAGHIKDSSAYSNLETSANATQATINAAINTKLGNVVDILMGTGGS